MVLALKQIGIMSELCLRLLCNVFWCINQTKASVTLSWEIKDAHSLGGGGGILYRPGCACFLNCALFQYFRQCYSSCKLHGV